MARVPSLPPDVVPVPGADWREEGDRVILLVPRFGNDLLGRVLRRFLREGTARVRLDDLGSAAWRCMDGRRTLAEIAALLREAAGEGAGDVTARLRAFLGTLHRHGWISFVRREEGGADRRGETA